MTATQIIYQKNFIPDIDGKPLDSGSLYIGVANQDPEVNPLTVYWDSALTQVATQPLSVSAGAVMHNGARAAVYTSSASYSFRAKNRSGTVVDYVAAANDSVVTLINNLASTASGKGADLVGYHDFIPTAYLQTLSDILNGLPVWFFRFVDPTKVPAIRDKTSTYDLDTELANAADADDVLTINFEPGLYNLSGALPVSMQGKHLKGSGWHGSELRINSTSEKAVTFANGVAGYGLSGWKITRNGTPVSGASGVEFLGTTDNSLLEDLWIEGHYTNLIIGTCDTGKIRRLRLNKALAYGCYQTNAASYGPSQWDVDDVLFDRNTVDGWRVQSTNGPAGLILGAMRNVRGFANGGRDLHVIGSSTTPVYGLRLTDAFFGSSNQGCIRLDTYGGRHRIHGTFERAGRDACGPTLAIAASNAAMGIEISANNVNAIVKGSIIDSNSYDGIEHNGGTLIAEANAIFNNGVAGTVGRRNGVLSQTSVNGTKLVLVGNALTNMPDVVGGTPPTYQQYGIAADHDDIVNVGDWMNGNATQASSISTTTNLVSFANATESSIRYYIPNTVDKLTVDQLLGLGATGGFQGAGGTANFTAVHDDGVLLT